MLFHARLIFFASAGRADQGLRSSRMTEGMKNPAAPTATMIVPATTKVVVSPTFSARNPVPSSLQGEEHSSVSFDKVLLTDNDGQVKVGAPVVKGAAVKCKILKHLKDDKVLVFKKKRRTGYQKCNGHRQYLTQILVEEIVA